MNAQLQTITELQPITQLQTEPIQPQSNIPSWSPALRIAFRFSMVYLGLYCLATQIIATPTGTDIPDPATLWPLRPVIFWTAAAREWPDRECRDRKSTRLNSSHMSISYAVFCLKKKK